MKVFTLVLLALGLAFAGCQSMESATDGVKERWDARSNGKTRVIQGEPKMVFAAALAAVKNMGFRVTKSGAAQGKIDAVNGLQSDNSLRSSRQIVLKVRISSVVDGNSVQLFLSEVIEADSRGAQGMGTETALVDTPMYEVFFRQVEQMSAQKK